MIFEVGSESSGYGCDPASSKDLQKRTESAPLAYGNFAPKRLRSRVDAGRPVFARRAMTFVSHLWKGVWIFPLSASR